MHVMGAGPHLIMFPTCEISAIIIIASGCVCLEERTEDKSKCKNKGKTFRKPEKKVLRNAVPLQSALSHVTTNNRAH